MAGAAPLVRVLFEGLSTPDQVQEVAIDGSSLPGGLYLVSLRGDGFRAVRTVTLLK